MTPADVQFLLYQSVSLLAVAFGFRVVIQLIRSL